MSEANNYNNGADHIDSAPLPPAEVYESEENHKLDASADAQSKLVRKPATQADQPGYDDSATAAEIVAANELITKISAWQPIARSDVLTIPELPTPIFEGLALPGTVALAPGEGGAGKTTLIMRMQMSVATGTEWLGFDCKLPGTSVHFLAEDDQTRAQYILTRLLLAETEQMRRETWDESAIDDYIDDVRRRVRLISVRGLGTTLATAHFASYRLTAVVDALCEELVKIPDLRIVTFDTLTRFAGVSLDSNDSAPTVLTALERIAESTKAFVLALHHTGKAVAREKNEDQYSARGASALSDHARLMLRIRPLDADEISAAGFLPGDEKNRRDYLRLTVPKSNYFSRPEPITICRMGFLFRLAADVNQQASDIYRAQFIALAAVIEDLQAQGMRTSKATLETQRSLGSRKKVRELIEICTEQGWLETRGNGGKAETVLTDAGRQVAQSQVRTSPPQSGEVAA